MFGNARGAAMIALDKLTFTDNAAVLGRSDGYVTCTVDVARVLQSWRESLFAYEWIGPDGGLKAASELSAAEQPKRAAVERKISKGEALEKPILGIGILENIEIGVGRATFLTLAALGVRAVPVHVPKSHEEEFSAFRA